LEEVFFEGKEAILLMGVRGKRGRIPDAGGDSVFIVEERTPLN